MRLETAPITREAQEWVCDTCGGRDHKSCGCNSAAHAEAIAAKKEANRQAARKYREKSEQNQQSRHNDANVENVEERKRDPEIWLGDAYLVRCHPPRTLRALIYKRMVEGLSLILASPRGRKITDEFLREVFEEFLAKRSEVLK